MEVEDTGAVALGDDLAVEGIVRARGAGGEVLLDQAAEVDRRHAAARARDALAVGVVGVLLLHAIAAGDRRGLVVGGPGVGASAAAEQVAVARIICLGSCRF